MSNIPPKKIAIFYGYPSGVNATFSVSGAANVFKDYDHVVFGDGLQENSHPDHANTVAIINDPVMVNTEVYGYIDATLPLNDIQDKIDKWAVMGIKGIFCDQFGYDFGLTREKQREIVWCIHEKNNGLKAFVNSWNVDDSFGSTVDPTHNPNGLETRLGANDLYLAESFVIISGNYDDNNLDSNNIKDWQDKATKMVNYRTTYGTKMTAIATGGAVPFDQNKADYAYYAAVLNDLDAWGWGEENFSASSAQLPFRTRKEIIGTQFTGSVVINGDIYTRQTNVGIGLDTNNHTVTTILN